jgi:hypothetical protein
MDIKQNTGPGRIALKKQQNTGEEIPLLQRKKCKQEISRTETHSERKNNDEDRGSG